MKKTALLAIGMALIFSVTMIGPVMAATQKCDKQNAPMDEMMGKDRMGCMKGDKPMRCMMEKQMVATSDGGVVISIGKKLYKYDSNLNLQKQVEIPIDMECMKKMDMQNMGPNAMPKGPAETGPKE